MKYSFFLLAFTLLVACQKHDGNIVIELKKSSVLANKVEVHSLEEFINSIDARKVNSLVIMLDNDADPMALKEAVSLAKNRGIQNISVASVDP